MLARSIAGRLYLIVGLLYGSAVLALGAVLLVWTQSDRQLEQKIATARENELRVLATEVALSKQVGHWERLQRANPSSPEVGQAWHAFLEQQMRVAYLSADLGSDDAESRVILDDFRAKLETFDRLTRGYMVQRAGAARHQNEERLAEISQVAQTIPARLTSLGRRSRELQQEYRRSGEVSTLRARQWAIACAVLCLVPGLLGATTLARKLSRRQKAIREVLDRATHGDRSSRVAIEGTDELARIAEAANLALDRAEEALQMYEAANRDIETKVVERTWELEQSRAQMKALLEGVRAVPWELDAATACITYLGPQAQELLGFGPDEATDSRAWFRRMTPEDRRQVIDILCNANEGEHGEVEHGIRNATGDWVRVKTLFTIQRLGGSLICRAISIDVTHQRQLEVELARSQKLEAVGQLAAGIAHEINTPAQFVGDSVSFLKSGLEDLSRLVTTYQKTLAAHEAALPADTMAALRSAEEAADLAYVLERSPEAAEAALEGIRRISEIVRAMKEFAHPDATEMTTVDLNDCIAKTLIVTRNEYKYVADIVTDYGPMPPIPGLRGELGQVFLNLIVNAAHAIQDAKRDARGVIRVQTRLEGDWAVVRIQDTGGGIPRHIQDRIFEPFFTTKEVGRGTGQGLAITRNVVVARHRGTLTFTTEMGRGTTFEVRLPARMAHLDTGELDEPEALAA